MTEIHHDLYHEFPEFKETIHNLKMNNTKFRDLYEEYNQLAKEVLAMENELTPVSTMTEENAKLHLLHLKDTLFTMMYEEQQESVNS